MLFKGETLKNDLWAVARSRGRIRGKGRARALDEAETSAAGRGKTKRVRRGSSSATAGTSNALDPRSNAGRRGGRGAATGPSYAARGGRGAATGPTNSARGRSTGGGRGDAERGRATNGGRGDAASDSTSGWYHLLFGEDGNTRNSAIPDLNADVIPYLNAQEEINVTQNAPTGHVE